MTINALIDLVTLASTHTDWRTITDTLNSKHHLGLEGHRIIRKSGERAGESKGVKWDAKEQLTWTMGNAITEDLCSPTIHPWHAVKICASAVQSKNTSSIGRTYVPTATALTPCAQCAHHRFEHDTDIQEQPCKLCDCTSFT